MGIDMLTRSLVSDTDSYRVHIRSATTGGPHPFAARPLLSLTRDSDVANDCYYNLATYGSVIGMVFCSDAVDTTDQLFMYNWRTGEYLLVRNASQVHRGFTKFDFYSG